MTSYEAEIDKIFLNNKPFLIVYVFNNVCKFLNKDTETKLKYDVSAVFHLSFDVLPAK